MRLVWLSWWLLERVWGLWPRVGLVDCGNSFPVFLMWDGVVRGTLMAYDVEMNELAQSKLELASYSLDRARSQKEQNFDHEAFRALWAATQQLFEIVLVQQSQINELEQAIKAKVKIRDRKGES